LCQKRQAHIFILPFCARADFDHIEDILKMVCRFPPAVPACLAGTFNNRQKMAVLRVFKHSGKLPGTPELITLGEIGQRVQPGGIGSIFFREPNLVTTEQLVIKRRCIAKI
jgi:hypothetical protein